MSRKARKWQRPDPLSSSLTPSLRAAASQAFGQCYHRDMATAFEHANLVKFSPLTLMLAGALIGAGEYSKALEHVGIDLGRYPEPETP
jgi:hypothetical protein